MCPCSTKFWSWTANLYPWNIKCTAEQSRQRRLEVGMELVPARPCYPNFRSCTSTLRTSRTRSAIASPDQSLLFHWKTWRAVLRVPSPQLERWGRASGPDPLASWTQLPPQTVHVSSTCRPYWKPGSSCQVRRRESAIQTIRQLLSTNVILINSTHRKVVARLTDSYSYVPPEMICNPHWI